MSRGHVRVARQVVVLARVIVDRDQVYLTADAITKLVSLLRSSDESAVILAGPLGCSAVE